MNLSNTDKFNGIRTPFYYYDTDLLRKTLQTINEETQKYDNYHVHYAVKANANLDVLSIINEYGIGIDCVSGGEVEQALRAGFPADKIVFAGVGKSDWEIELGIDKNIFCFNVESIPELEVINEIAARKGKTANVCFRINPNVGAHTHSNITTGLAENKFGIAMEDMEKVILLAKTMNNIAFKGIHFHIGSQILDMGDFEALANRINELQDRLEAAGLKVEIVNVGGGLGIDYQNPNGIIRKNWSPARLDHLRALEEQVDFKGAFDWIYRYDKNFDKGREFEGTDVAFLNALFRGSGISAL